MIDLERKSGKEPATVVRFEEAGTFVSTSGREFFLTKQGGWFRLRERGSGGEDEAIKGDGAAYLSNLVQEASRKKSLVTL